MRLCLGLSTHNFGLEVASRLLVIHCKGGGAVEGREKISLNVKAKVFGLFEATAQKEAIIKNY